MKPLLVFMLLLAAASAAVAQSDICSNAPAIGDGSYYGQTYAATIDGSSCKAGPDVWYRYTAVENGTVVLASYGSFDVSISVHSGCGAGNQIACGTASCWDSWFRNCTSFTATAGSDYWIRVSGDPARISRGWYDLMIFRPGYISGMVTDSITGQPLDGAVQLEELSGKFTASVNLNADGSYLSGPLPPGSYAAKAVGSDDHVWEVYDNIRCFPAISICGPGFPCVYFCEATTRTPVSVSQDSVTPNINFALDLFGSLSGQVSIEGTGAPVPWASVYLYDSTGQRVPSGSADANGSFQATLPEGQYFAVTQTELINEVYDDHTCPSVCMGDCDPLSGTPISVAPGSNTPGIDFSLSEGGVLSGIIADASNGSPLSSATLYLMKFSGISVSAGHTDSNGSYRLAGIPPGSYTLRVWITGYEDQVVNDVVFTEGQHSQMNFNLVSLSLVGGRIAGNITRADNGQPLGNAGLRFSKTSGQNGYDSLTLSAADGTYTSAPLPVGEYSVFVSLNGFAGEIYDGIFCNNCPPDQGIPVTVAAGQTTTGIDFDLQQSGCIIGHVLSSTGAIANATVTVYDSLSHRINDKQVDNQGLYSICDLPPGDYFAVATNTPGFIDQLYAARDCMMGSCEKTMGTPVNVSPGGITSGIDFTLRFGGSISGTLTEGPFGYSFQQGGNLRAFDAGGNLVSLTTQYPGSHYRLGGLVAGNYHVTAETYGLAGQLYPGLPCQSGLCDPSPGASIAVTEGQDTSGIHFMLNESRSFSGTIRDAATGEPLPYVQLKIFDPAGNSVNDDFQIMSDCFGRYTVASLVPDTYFAIARSSGYIDQLYQGIPCPEGICDPLSGTPINVIPGTDATDIDFALIPEDLMFFDNFEDDSLSKAWAYPNGVWTEADGFLIGSSKQKAEALALPAFGGCSKCSVVAVLQTIDKPSAGVFLSDGTRMLITM